MKTLFPGYFTPDDQEFAALWAEATFGFDASVLLGLYRSTLETQKVFFDVIDKIKDRVFLPHQAAFEYLKNRRRVISTRTDSYATIKSESDKFAKFLEATIQEHALPNGESIINAATEAVKKIADLVEAAEENEPDSLKSDALLGRLVDLFGTTTGQPFEPAKLKERLAEASQRYALKIPPGYKDEAKGEPDKYGDVLVWFQLIEHAKLTKKPVIFVTGDLKEDWWLQHKGATVGPRPELRQEMMAAAAVHFYMYTTPRFLEFAKQFLNLGFDTKRAETEFEEIERQDKQADMLAGFKRLAISQRPTEWQNWAIGNPSGSTTPSFTYFDESGVTQADFSDEAVANAEWFQAATVAGTGWTPNWTTPEPKNQYFQLLPIDGHVFPSSTGSWRCKIVRNPTLVGLDRICFHLKFDPINRVGESKYLELWVSAQRLHHDGDGRFKSVILGGISRWLSGSEYLGQLAYTS
jgi:PIN like domain